MNKKKSNVTARDIFTHAEKIYQSSIALKYTLKSWPPEDSMEVTLTFTPAYYVTTSFVFELLLKTLLVIGGHCSNEFYRKKYGHGLVNMFGLLPEEWKTEMDQEFNHIIEVSPQYKIDKDFMAMMGNKEYKHQSLREVLELNNDRFKDFRYAYELSNEYMIQAFSHNDHEMVKLINLIRNYIVKLKPELEADLLNSDWVSDLRNNRKPSPMTKM